MTEYKKQHFVPCSYLRFFSSTGEWREGRKTRIFFTDGHKSLSVPIKDLAFSNYTYSRLNPAYDKVFHDTESDYPKIITKVLNQSPLSINERMRLLTISWVLHLRNIIYKNKTKHERKNLFETIQISFMQSIYGENRFLSTEIERYEYLKANWDIKFLTPETNEKFLTSDNPSIIFSIPNANIPVLVLLPIHPKLLFVGYYKRYVRINDARVNDHTLGILNGVQGRNCNKHIYSDHDLLDSNTDLDNLKSVLNRDRPSGYIDHQKWQANFYHFDDNALKDIHFLSRINKTISNSVRTAIKNIIIN